MSGNLSLYVTNWMILLRLLNLMPINYGTADRNPDGARFSGFDRPDDPQGHQVVQEVETKLIEMLTMFGEARLSIHLNAFLKRD